MIVTESEAEKILDAMETVCIYCIEDTLSNPSVCEHCPVSKTCDSLEWDDVE